MCVTFTFDRRRVSRGQLVFSLPGNLGRRGSEWSDPFGSFK